jgi:DNA-binding NarL/FixJ family response regulator
VKTVRVVADDLIWASRLQAAVQKAGAAPVRQGGDAAVVDLNGRTYDGVRAVAEAVATGTPTIAVVQHEDLELRKRALAAGARRVYSYNKMHSDGPRLVAALLEGAS